MRLGDLDALKESIEKITWYHINKEGQLVKGANSSLNPVYHADDIYNAIDNAPTVVKDYDTGYQDGLEDGLNDIRPQGKWICDYRTRKCSVCNFTTVIDTYNFCPDCGADMRGDKE